MITASSGAVARSRTVLGAPCRGVRGRSSLRRVDGVLVDLQKAIVVAHARARTLYRTRLVLVVTLGVAGIAVSSVSSGGHPPQVAASLATALAIVPLAASAVVGSMERTRLGVGAELQARFDRAFDGGAPDPFIPQPSQERVEALRTRWHGDRHDLDRLEHWYPDTSELDPADAALYRVWLNAAWDVPLRRTMQTMAASVFGLWLAPGALIAVGGRGLGWFLAVWVAPSTAVLGHAVETWFRHGSLARDKADLAAKVEQVLAGADPRADGDPRGLVLAAERALYELRCRAPRVARWPQRRWHDRRWAESLAFLSRCRPAIVS